MEKNCQIKYIVRRLILSTFCLQTNKNFPNIFISNVLNCHYMIKIKG